MSGYILAYTTLHGEHEWQGPYGTQLEAWTECPNLSSLHPDEPVYLLPVDQKDEQDTIQVSTLRASARSVHQPPPEVQGGI